MLPFELKSPASEMYTTPPSLTKNARSAIILWQPAFVLIYKILLTRFWFSTIRKEEGIKREFGVSPKLFPQL